MVSGCGRGEGTGDEGNWGVKESGDRCVCTEYLVVICTSTLKTGQVHDKPEQVKVREEREERR